MLLALLWQATAPEGAAPAPPQPAPWAVVTRAAPTSQATTSSAWSTENNARLVVRCDVSSEKIVSIQFIPKPGFEPALPRPVSINVDGNGWFGTNWQFPGNGAFVSDDVIVSNLAVMIAQGKSIHVRVIDPQEKVVEAHFTGPGEAPIRQVLSACGYDYGKPPPRAPAPAPGAGTAADPPDSE